MDSGNEYVIQIKENQKTLLAGVQKTIRKNKVVDEYIKNEINRGRKEKRRVRIYLNDKGYISKDWKNVNRLIEVVNSGFREGHHYSENHYYISSLCKNSAQVFGKGIREHWAIENKLHRVKDVLQNEDDCLIAEKRIAANLSLMKSVSISIYRLNGYESVKLALERFKNRVEDCAKLIGIKLICKN